MHLLTERHQNVAVMTVSTLRSHLESISQRASRFTIHKVHGDHVSIRSDHAEAGTRKLSYVVLPAYPTGCPNDAPCSNLNVILDPLRFIDADTTAERDVFAPLLGHEALAHYEKLHQEAGLSVSRCC